MMDAEFMATGHYVRIRKADGGFQLLRAVDHFKDQSYVLHVLNQNKLAHALFPIGDYPKTEIRRFARDFDLPTASRVDSQDLCFLAGEDYRDFLQRNAQELLKPGEIARRDGRVVGHHQGLANYTIGQRKGLGLSSPLPLYVLEKDAVTNTLIVGQADELGNRELTARDVNWLAGEAPSEPFRALVKTRYTAKEAEALVTLLGSRMTFPTLLFAILIAVFYAGLFHLLRGGGGWKMLLYIGLSVLGFAAGQLLGMWRGWLILMLGPINLGLGTLGSVVLMVLGNWLSHIEGKRESRV
jgi:tRNA-specific 2-thiouridylase